MSEAIAVTEAPPRPVAQSAQITAESKAIIVDVRDLRKTFIRRVPDPNTPAWRQWLPFGKRISETYTAVNGINFTIRQGEIFGLLGPNGAGKTTTIRMLSTLLQPSGGTATLNGYDVAKQATQVRQNLGAVLTGERSIYWKLTGRENLEYFAALYHIPPAIAKQRVNELLARLGLANRADEAVEGYSSGMKQRIAIAKALLANPPIVLLDEPTIGLDPQSARNLRELIAEIRAEGRTVLLTTHYMEEADLLCDRVGIIDLGKIIALDTPANLKQSIKQLDVLQLEIDEYTPAITAMLEQFPEIQHIAAHYNDTERAWSLKLHTNESRTLLPRLLERINALAGQIRHLTIKQPSLEDVFITLTGKQLRD